MEDAINIAFKGTTKIRIICGNCKNPLSNEHYTIYDGEKINTFQVFPCDCVKVFKIDNQE